MTRFVAFKSLPHPKFCPCDGMVDIAGLDPVAERRGSSTLPSGTKFKEDVSMMPVNMHLPIPASLLIIVITLGIWLAILTH